MPLLEPQERDAEIVRDALFGSSVNLNALIEIACTRTSAELFLVKQVYRLRCNYDVEQDIALETEGGFKGIVSLVSERNTEQLKCILVSYKELYGDEFSLFLKQNKCRKFGKELRIVVRGMQYPERFFAKQLRRALQNRDAREGMLGSRDIVTRIIVTCLEVDIEGISNVFAAKTGWSLATKPCKKAIHHCWYEQQQCQ
ncbi:hypothetical protein L1049_001997 [Liquidambar formosana]|uniref:Uncharacterized protein n=1 Tax=Liquidambar formosana TaxID=63359 RepID=A0AAP0R7X7_LIQFO